MARPQPPEPRVVTGGRNAAEALQRMRKTAGDRAEDYAVALAEMEARFSQAVEDLAAIRIPDEEPEADPDETKKD